MNLKNNSKGARITAKTIEFPHTIADKHFQQWLY